MSRGATHLSRKISNPKNGARRLPSLVISLRKAFLLNTHPAKMQVSRPPSGISTFAVARSKRSKMSPAERQSIDDAIEIAVATVAALRREWLWCFWKYSVSTSWKVIVEVRAANAISRKNIADHNSGIGISWNTNGSVSNISVGPCVGCKPSTLNTAGKIIIPESIATKKVSIDDDHAVVARFVPLLK